MRLMSQGTKSVLFGCHNIVHSINVIRSWRVIYGRWPNYWQLGCILLHDVGHIGKNYLDDYEEKKKHQNLGAWLSGMLFGYKGYFMVLGHNQYSDEPKSLLHDPDKYSWLIAPRWWLWFNCIVEPELHRPGKTKWQSVDMFQGAIRDQIINSREGEFISAHEVYLSHDNGGGSEEV